jgi:LuxR family maltose regulon positive regulatory protein
MGSALTLVSAPAGFGKTTLLTDWLTASPADKFFPTWLSLDQRDNDPALFWPYVVAALSTADPDVGKNSLSLLRSPQPPAIQVVLVTLLNDLNALPSEIVLVLDDYHLIESREIQDGMAFLVEHLPPQVHLVLASRADPPLPLARWRGRGELVEIRAADLRFTAEEAATYLNDVVGLDLTAEDVATLERRTEGLDHRDPAGRALDAGPQRHCRLPRRVHRRRSLHRRLPGRGGAAASAPTSPAIPAADLHPEPAQRLPL